MHEQVGAAAEGGAPQQRFTSPFFGISLGLKLLSVGPLLILVALVVIIAIVTPNSLKPGNISNILAQTAVIAIVAIGQHLVILTRGIDLSVGANLALSTVVGALVFRVTDNPAAVMLAMLLTGGAVGAVNGLVYVFGRLPHPFIITLATLSICRGLALELAIGHTTMRGMPSAIGALGGGSVAGIPGSFFVVFGVAALVFVMAKTMVWGRWIYAVGGKPEAAVQMGIPVRGVLVSSYVISGLCAGIGAIVLAGRTEAGSPLYGNLLELDTIAAVIIGGALVHRARIEKAHPPRQPGRGCKFTAAIEVLGRGQIVEERKVLIDGLDAGAPRRGRTIELHRRTIDDDLAFVECVHAADAFHQGRLARAIVAK